MYYQVVTIYQYFLFQDPTNPLNKEQQKKAWQDQSSRNVLIKKGAKAFEIEKIPLTKEQKKAKWKADKTGKVINIKYYKHLKSLLWAEQVHLSVQVGSFGHVNC